MALIVDESSPEFLLAPGEGGGRPRELREPSVFNFDIASLKRLDIGSDSVSITAEDTRIGEILTFLSKVCGRQNSRHRVTLRHLLEDLDEKANLDLGRLLKQSIQSCSSFRFTQDAKPLLNGAEFILKVLIESSRSHFFQGGLVLIDVGNPLLSRPVEGIVHVSLTLGLLIEENFG
jgi:hypothetical protein